MNGGSGTSHVVNLIDFQENRLDQVMTNQLEVRLSQQMGNVLFRSGKKIIHAKHIGAVCHQPVTKMTPKKTRTTRYKHSDIFHALLSTKKTFRNTIARLEKPIRYTQTMPRTTNPSQKKGPIGLSRHRCDGCRTTTVTRLSATKKYVNHLEKLKNLVFMG
jgi:hypothetical protein